MEKDLRLPCVITEVIGILFNVQFNRRIRSHCSMLNVLDVLDVLDAAPHSADDNGHDDDEKCLRCRL